MNPFGSKPKVSRTKKTFEEKAKALAEKELLRLLKSDPNVLRQYIQLQYHIDIRPESERTFTRLVEETKIRAYQTVADDLVQDPEVIEALRDKYIDELLGLPPNQPKAKEKGGRSQQPNLQSQLEKVKQTIQLADQYKQLLGANENSWSKVFQNPEVIKTVRGLIQPLLGSFGLPQEIAAADSNGGMYAIEKDGELIEVDHKTYVQYISKQKALELPITSHTTPDQKEPTDKPVAASGNPISQPLPAASPATTSEQDKDVQK